MTRSPFFSRVSVKLTFGTVMPANVAAIALVIPTVFHQAAAAVPVAAGGWTPAKEQGLSLAIAVVLFLTYALTLVFTLVTHRELFGGDESKAIAREAGEEWTRIEAERERAPSGHDQIDEHRHPRGRPARPRRRHGQR